MLGFPAPLKYVGFCDVLGFSSAVLHDFDASIALYQQFRSDVRQWPFPPKAQVSVYSDSILIVSDELPDVVNAIVALHWAALMRDWLIRGGVAYGKYWEEKEGGNLFVVSDALVKAVALEKSVKIPAVVISEEIPLGIEAWVPRFQHGPFKAPLLHFGGHSIVNPFNEYWFASAAKRAKRLLDAHPQHKEKYEWFLSLVEAVARDDILIPEAALARMLELGILQKRPESAA
ncbi:MAG: hypothetical protein BroJett026_02710 [Betaproteobacteria bacterium]|nr:MAG: hypothetical protein BroJett026_02710 [Betaproteobacteria bacterium]